MQDFLDDLERRLSQAAIQDAPAAKPARSPRNLRRRRPAILGGLTAALAAAAAAFTMTGTSLADLPILQTDTQDASEVARAAPEAAEAGMDFSKAHPFATPGGPGYALTDEARRSLCVAVPDPAAPGTYGVTCSPLEAAERQGQYVSVADPGTATRAPSIVNVFVLPEDAENVVLESAGRQTEPTIESGVVVARLTDAGRLTWSVDGRDGELALLAPLRPATASVVTCSDGTRRTLENLGPTNGDEAAREEFRERSRKACRQR